jgi:hypothetical protein
LYESILKKKINIRENVIEKFLIKVVEHSNKNFEKVEGFLLKSDCLLSQKIIERLIEECNKVKIFILKIIFFK